MSHEAYEELDSLIRDVDKLVYGFAEHKAKQRNPAACPIKIEADDIKLVANTLKTYLSNHNIWDDVSPTAG